jgi:penicillin amidase
MNRICFRAFLLAALVGCTATGPSNSGEGSWNQYPVEIIRDDHGVPHIYAQSDTDLFHAAGYQLAVDRLYQAEMLRRFSQGRLSEVLGEEAIERDQQVRIFDVARWAREDLIWMQEHDPERVVLVRAWVAGINRRIDEVLAGDVPLPFGYGPDGHDFLPTHWQDLDPYIILKGANFASDKTLEAEIALTLIETLYPETLEAVQILKPATQTFGLPLSERPPSEGESVPPIRDRPSIDEVDARALVAWAKGLERPAGSNNWAVHGSNTATGQALLAGDPHLGFDFFGAPMPMHLNSKDAGGSFDVAGFSFPGTPGIALGHNDAVAWTATTAFVDVMDVFDVERIGEGVRLGEEVLPITLREERFLVRIPGGLVGEGDELVDIYEDVEGVGVILPDSFLPISLGDYLVTWTGFTGRRAAWFMELNQAKDLDDFEARVSRMTEMNYNLVAASAEGIAYAVGCEAPDRGAIGGRERPWMVMDGGDPDVLWSDARLDASQKPASRGEDRGWIATANNDPWGFTADGDVTNDPFYYGSIFAPGYRAHRIETRLEEMLQAAPLTLDDMKALQMDTASTLADHLLPMLLEAAQRDALSDLPQYAQDEHFAVLISLLDDWDGRMDRDSTGALAFHTFLHQIAQTVLADDLGVVYDFAIELQTSFVLKIADLALRGEYQSGDSAGAGVLQDGVDATLLVAARSTAEALVAAHGGVDVRTWGEVKATRFDSALGYGIPLFDVPSDGGEDTINVAQSIATDMETQPWTSSHVSVERSVFAIAPDGIPELWSQYAFGAQADPYSADSDAAMEGYIEGEHRRFWFRRAEVDAHTREVHQLDPGLP